MKFYKFNFYANYANHFGTQWAVSAYDVERDILAQNPSATGIYVWGV